MTRTIRLGSLNIEFRPGEGLFMREAHSHSAGVPPAPLRIYAADMAEFVEFIAEHFPAEQKSKEYPSKPF